MSVDLNVFKVRGHTLRLQLQVAGLSENMRGELRFSIPAEIEIAPKAPGASAAAGASQSASAAAGASQAPQEAAQGASPGQPPEKRQRQASPGPPHDGGSSDVEFVGEQPSPK
ncbi:unnamed protein product, partial [Prorocentrum cordatum]